MARYALVNSSTKIVENVIIVEDETDYAVPEGQELVQEKRLTTGPAIIGGTWDGEKFGPDPNAPPLA